MSCYSRWRRNQLTKTNNLTNIDEFGGIAIFDTW